MGCNENYVGAFPACLPQRLSRLHSEAFCFVIFCKNNSVAAIGVSRHSHRFSPQSGIETGLHRGVKIIHIRMEYHSVRFYHLPNNCSISIPSELMFVKAKN